MMVYVFKINYWSVELSVLDVQDLMETHSMKTLYLFLLIFSLISINVFASDLHTKNSRMCLTAYLMKQIHFGEVTFYVRNQPIGGISIYGSWVDVVGIIDFYFKSQKDFEAQKEFLRVENNGHKLDVKRFTYEAC